LEQVAELDSDRILGLRLEIVGICQACGERLSDEEKEQLRRRWERT
jgi:hypothetical protein